MNHNSLWFFTSNYKWIECFKNEADKYVSVVLTISGARNYCVPQTPRNVTTFQPYSETIWTQCINHDATPFLSTALWACTSECKVLGHSDRCWNPPATRPNTSMACAPHLSTFSKTASLPRDTRRENYYPSHVVKPNALQSVYEKVQQTEFDYILVGPPTPARIQETDEISIPEYANS